jgi:hypothetical protein
VLPSIGDMKPAEKREFKEEVEYYAVGSLLDAMTPWKNAISVQFASTSLPDGIFQWLGTKGFSSSFTNPVTLGEVSVVSNGCYSFTDSSLAGKILFEKNWRTNTASSFASSTSNTPTDFVFAHYMVRLTAYYIYCSYSGYDPKNWTISASNGDGIWTVLKVHKDEPPSNMKGHIWTIDNDNFYSQYRITPGNPCTTSNSQQFVCNYIDFAGELFKNEDFVSAKQSMFSIVPKKKK